MKLISGAVCAASLSAGAALAAPVTFDFTGGAGQSSVASYTEGSLALSVTALSVNEPGAIRSGTQSDVFMGPMGLGVLNRIGTVDPEMNTSVDGKSLRGFNDLLLFEFGSRVASAVVRFAERPGFEASRFVPYFETAAGLAPGGPSTDIDVTTSLSIDGTVFGLAAFGDDDQFYVSSLTVSMAPAVVPLPAAGWMSLLGLGALGLLRRR